MHKYYITFCIKNENKEISIGNVTIKSSSTGKMITEKEIDKCKQLIKSDILKIEGEKVRDIVIINIIELED